MLYIVILTLVFISLVFPFILHDVDVKYLTQTLTYTLQKVVLFS